MKRSSTLITSVNFEDAQDIRSPNNNKLPFYDVVYNERRIQSNKLKYITKDELIIKLVFCEEIKPQVVLKMLLDLYDHPNVSFKSNLMQSYAGSNISEAKADNNRLLVITAIERWLNTFNDFYEDEELYSMLTTFIAQTEEKYSFQKFPLPKSFVTLSKTIKKFKERAVDYESQITKFKITDVNDGPFTILSSKYSVEFIAQQLTLLEFEITKNVKPIEYFSYHDDTQNLNYYLNYMNKIRILFGTELLDDSVKNMLNLIKIAIDIAEKCLLYNNFNTPIEILNAIYSPHLIVKERFKVWDSMPQKLFERIERLSRIFNPEDNYATYKQEYPNFFPPCIPFIYSHLNEIRFVNDFNNTYYPGEGYNFEKFQSISSILSKVLPCFETTYPFEANIEFQKKLLFHLENSIDSEYEVLSFREVKSNYENSLKLSYLRSKYEIFFTQTSIFGKEEMTYYENKLTPRDWQIITTGANLRTYQKGECIFNDSKHILVLQEGEVQLSKNGIKLNKIKPPAILNDSPIFELIATPPTLIASETCAIEVIENNFLISLLESDLQLSTRFFTTIAYQLYKQLNLLNQKEIYYVEVQSPKSYQSPDQKKHVVVKANRSNSVSSLSLRKSLSQKDIRDKEIRGLFSWGNDEVLIKEYKATLLGKTLNAQGTLFISQHHVCFFAKLLTRKIKVVISFVEISKVQRKKNKLQIESFSALKKKRLELKLNNGEEEEAYGLIDGIVSSLEGKVMNKDIYPPKPVHHTASMTNWKDSYVNPKLNIFRLTETDWDSLKKGAKKLVIAQGNIVIQQGTISNRIFYISKGVCRVEMVTNGREKLLGMIKESEFFGERCFLANKPVATSVIVDSSDAEVLIFEASFLKRLFRVKGDIESRFLYTICCSLLRKLEVMSRYEDEEERKILDIIGEPLFLLFHRHSTIRHVKRTPFHIIHGPVINERKEFEYCLNEARSYCGGTSISTYPIKQNAEFLLNGSEEDVEQIREGSPICDQYRAEFFHTRAIIALADGCNWGDPPREAARAARDAFVHYLRNHHCEIMDVQNAGSLVLRAFSIANAAIMKEKIASIQKIGTTTLLGGILLQLEPSFTPSLVNSANIMQDGSLGDSENSISQYEELSEASIGSNILSNAENWAFVYGSVGDCKVFHWSLKTGKFTDITMNNRVSITNATDSGGRLGPYLPGNLPDLRNFELGLLPCDTGDYLLLLSDGVHDNFDIAFLGKQPRDYDIDSDNWDNLPDPKLAEEIKNFHRIKKLEEVIYSSYDEKEREERIEKRQMPPPIDIVRNLMSYCREICAAAANWMQKNPNRRLPKDFTLYPGKMDHSTCICIVVKEQLEENDLTDSD